MKVTLTPYITTSLPLLPTQYHGTHCTWNHMFVILVLRDSFGTHTTPEHSTLSH